jgi:pilus assembly protein Flp/PilA
MFNAKIQTKDYCMPELFTAFARDRVGATSIEYALIAAGIAVGIVAVVQGLGTSVNALFASVQTGLK